jgi:hypothetical protein
VRRGAVLHLGPADHRHRAGMEEKSRAGGEEGAEIYTDEHGHARAAAE